MVDKMFDCRWEVGGRSLPLNTVLRILRDVYTLRGDWRTALLKNISQRCLKPLESRNQFIRQRHKGFQERTKDAVQLVRSSLGAERHDLLPSELREMEKQRKKSMRNRN
uniref:SAM-dependent MTase TRM10-type domain-containing protein n=1 Tax=Plectus sambesii TaxID=2011161 RepID=A0A914V5I2_9BILA